MDRIIDSITDTLNGLDNTPCIIYMGIGTYGGMLTNNNGHYILEDKNYHQFPPTLQKIYRDNKDVHIFIILVDPLQEKPVFMSKDDNLKEKLFNNLDWITLEDNLEIYINNRITVYPFRHMVKTHAYDMHDIDDIVDITCHLDRINKISIDKDLTFIYHDFSGRDTSFHIEKYFYNSIKNNLDHIIYGLGNGLINECYFDFTTPASFLATKIDYRSRKLITSFNLRYIIEKYKDKPNNISFEEYIYDIIDSYGLENYENIQGQIQITIDNFKYKFKNYIIYIFRIIKDFNDKLINGGVCERINEIMYYISTFSKDISDYINNLVRHKDINIFEKTLEMFGKLYKNEIKIALMNSQYSNYSYIDILKIVTENQDKYKWFESFNMIFG